VNTDRMRERKLFRPAIGAGATVLCGLILWGTPQLGETWVNASYDTLFRFGSHAVTNEVAVILMDDAARRQLGPQPGGLWPRASHAKLLNKLAKDGCPLVVFDVVFSTRIAPETDETLERAIKRMPAMVLAGKQDQIEHPDLDGNQMVLPYGPFLAAAGSNNWGVAWLVADKRDQIVRRHWPFPSPDDTLPSLPWVAAELFGARLSKTPQERWLRYYAKDGACSRFDYHFALGKPDGYFTNKIVFVGDKERDLKRTPYTSWTGESSSGVEILATQFLNLVNGDWLRRPHRAVEICLLTIVGIAFGAGLQFLNRWVGGLVTLAAILAVTMGAVLLGHFSNIWFPWLIIVGGQLPCAWLCALPRTSKRARTEVAPGGTVVVDIPYTPDYNRVCKLGKGGFGEVWLVRNAIGQWQALKVVYRDNFENEHHYNYEFAGIEKYKPVSEKHQGLMRIELISQKRPEGYYYYVMELGDAQFPGWEKQPALYKPRDLGILREKAYGRRLPPKECVRIVAALADALDFLHQQGLTHRDIKPANIIFVNGQPKLADVGLVTQVRLPDQTTTQVGTPGYMPPEPEPQGTVQADIYALGMVLYVISTGATPQLFPELSKTLFERSSSAEFLRLNPVILKACHPNRAQRFHSASEFRDALLALTDLDQPGSSDPATS
jgi:CHASE2 domain-containing sensor protein